MLAPRISLSGPIALLERLNSLRETAMGLLVGFARLCGWCPLS
jgi:hypothetical protein